MIANIHVVRHLVAGACAFLFMTGSLCGVAASFRQYPTLPLPVKYKGKRIFHRPSPRVNGFSCGYHVLYNACCKNNELGIANKYASQTLFKQQALAYLKRKHPHIRADQASTNVMLEELAKLYNLNNFVYLMLDNGVPAPLIKHVRVTYRIGTSRQQIERMMYDQRRRMQDGIVAACVKKYTSVPNHTTCCLHFACHVVDYGVDHVILLSLEKVKGKKAITIYDNNDRQIFAGSMADKYIDFMCRTFGV